jgi:hypothetical protein
MRRSEGMKNDGEEEEPRRSTGATLREGRTNDGKKPERNGTEQNNGVHDKASRKNGHTWNGGIDGTLA